MELLYKYYSAKGHTLENLKLMKNCFSNYGFFNDPFEGIGRFTYTIEQGNRKFWDVVNPGIGENLAKCSQTSRMR